MLLLKLESHNSISKEFLNSLLGRISKDFWAIRFIQIHKNLSVVEGSQLMHSNTTLTLEILS